jgi:hypothetical protein
MVKGERMIRVAIVAGKVDSGGKKNLIMEYYRHVNRDEVQFDFIAIPTHRLFRPKK